jgi:aspartyl-tRNA(Asn)/glutamyl-tRNA(Gln) amidotransferase subunit A
MSISHLQDQYRRQEITATAVLDQTYARIDREDTQVNSFLSHTRGIAYEIAAEVDARLAKGETLPPLAGIPLGVKDNMHMLGELTTCASKILANFRAPYNATVIERCKQSLMLPIGKLNMDEFAMGSSTENSAYFSTKNPWDLSRVPGGSSGGSAAAVAAGFVPLSLGSDTGGSIRQPASFCGVTGLKPTYGRVSRYGLVAFASSLDQIGPLGRSVADCAALLDAISGHDPRDATSAMLPATTVLSHLATPQKSLRIGVPRELMGPEIDDAVKACVESAIRWYEQQGHQIVWCDMASFSAAVATYYIIAPAEASANLSRYDGVRYGLRDRDATNLKSMMSDTRGKGFGPEVKRRIILGTYVLSSGYYDAFYAKAQQVRALITYEFEQAFRNVDVLLTPTAPTTAFSFGAHAADPLAMYLADIATIPVNMAGLPALSLPCGFSEGLPVGMQLIGRSWDENTIMGLGHQFQLGTDYHTQVPTIGSVA